MTTNRVTQIDDAVPIRRALVSVYDKQGLGQFVPRLRELCPALRLLSTGGTHRRLAEILQAAAPECLTQVSAYTGQPETQGGLVKTLDFKIYLGLLSETYNDDHRRDLERTGAATFDLVVTNLYPFQAASSAEGATVETARGHIDIGGPCMVRAAAKNFLRTAPVVDPADYPWLSETLASLGGSLDLASRFRLARKAFAVTADYDRAVAAYFEGVDPAAGLPYAFAPA